MKKKASILKDNKPTNKQHEHRWRQTDTHTHEKRSKLFISTYIHINDEEYLRECGIENIQEIRANDSIIRSYGDMSESATSWWDIAQIDLKWTKETEEEEKKTNIT